MASTSDGVGKRLISDDLLYIIKNDFSKFTKMIICKRRVIIILDD